MSHAGRRAGLQMGCMRTAFVTRTGCEVLLWKPVQPTGPCSPATGHHAPPPSTTYLTHQFLMQIIKTGVLPALSSGVGAGGSGLEAASGSIGVRSSLGENLPSCLLLPGASSMVASRLLVVAQTDERLLSAASHLQVIFSPAVYRRSALPPTPTSPDINTPPLELRDDFQGAHASVWVCVCRSTAPRGDGKSAGWAGLVVVPQISHHSLLTMSVWEGEGASFSLSLGLSAGFCRQWEDRLTRPVGPVRGGEMSDFICHLSGELDVFSAAGEAKARWFKGNVSCVRRTISGEPATFSMWFWVTKRIRPDI